MGCDTIKKLTIMTKEEELKGKLEELEAKYAKMRSLTIKVGKEMDSLAEQYLSVLEELNNLKGN